jgi:hypothetical protein
MTAAPDTVPGVPGTTPACPLGLSFSRATGQYYIRLGYADLGEIMDQVYAVWEAVAAGQSATRIEDLIEDLIGHLDGLRAWTGEPQ